jgi:hypothetical protein
MKCRSEEEAQDFCNRSVHSVPLATVLRMWAQWEPDAMAREV